MFLESPDPNSGSPAQLYLRDTAAGTTTPVSNGDGTHSALFAGAADDGSKAFFLTDEQLTGDDTDTDMDVYEYDTASDTLTRASHGSGAEDANVAGVAWVSDNGAHLYFVAMNQIAGGGTPGSRTSTATTPRPMRPRSSPRCRPTTAASGPVTSRATTHSGRRTATRSSSSRTRT